MTWSAQRQVGFGVATLLCLASAAGNAQAEDFLSALFGGFAPPAPRAYAPQLSPLPDASEGLGRVPSGEPRPGRSGYALGEPAYCVRTCDGRYFPATASDQQSRASSCTSLCPASETKVFYGDRIDNASTTSGKSYSELPNAFKYRNEIVAGCTCNGKDQFGLAKVGIEDDPTLRKGDVVVGADGLMIAGRRADRPHGVLKLSPAPASLRARYERVPVLAAD
jgi:hypothetical protein